MSEERVSVSYVMKCPAVDGGRGKITKPVQEVVSRRGGKFCPKCHLEQPCAEHAKQLGAESKETV
jgi:hypothetical protein